MGKTVKKAERRQKALTRDGVCGKIRKLSREGSGRKGRNHTGVWKKALKKVLTNGTGCGMIGRLSSKGRRESQNERMGS